MNMSLSLAKAVADAVLYEGYLLYPYRASSQKNQARWQFGILGPRGAAAAGVGEEAEMFADCLLSPGPDAELEVHLRFLQLQSRTAEKAVDGGGFSPVDELTVGAARWLSWDEAVEQDVALGPFPLSLAGPAAERGTAGGGPRRRGGGGPPRRRRPAGWPVGPASSALHGEVSLDAAPAGGGLVRLRVAVANVAAGTAAAETGDRQDAIARSFIGTHADSDAAGRGFPVPARPAGAGAGGRRILLAAPLLARPRRSGRADRRAAGFPDHPVRPPLRGPGKLRGPV